VSNLAGSGGRGEAVEGEGSVLRDLDEATVGDQRRGQTADTVGRRAGPAAARLAQDCRDRALGVQKVQGRLEAPQARDRGPRHDHDRTCIGQQAGQPGVSIQDLLDSEADVDDRDLPGVDR
jgi:hypothetical protein